MRSLGPSLRRPRSERLRTEVLRLYQSIELGVKRRSGSNWRGELSDDEACEAGRSGERKENLALCLFMLLESERGLAGRRLGGNWLWVFRKV